MAEPLDAEAATPAKNAMKAEDLDHSSPDEPAAKVRKLKHAPFSGQKKGPGRPRTFEHKANDPTQKKLSFAPKPPSAVPPLVSGHAVGSDAEAQAPGDAAGSSAEANAPDDAVGSSPKAQALGDAAGSSAEAQAEMPQQPAQLNLVRKRKRPDSSGVAKGQLTGPKAELEKRVEAATLIRDKKLTKPAAVKKYRKGITTIRLWCRNLKANKAELDAMKDEGTFRLPGAHSSIKRRATLGTGSKIALPTLCKRMTEHLLQAVSERIHIQRSRALDMFRKEALKVYPKGYLEPEVSAYIRHWHKRVYQKRVCGSL